MTEKTKIIFFGSHSISLPLLKFLKENNSAELVGIVSQADKPTGRGKKVSHTAVSDFALSNKIALHRPQFPNETTVDWMKAQRGELVLVMAYGHILKKNILDFPKLGIYNFHASILPKYRGAAPIETAIACGEKVTGVSLMQMVEKMDAGNVVDIEKVQIDEHDTFLEVSKKISHSCPVLLERNLNALCSGSIQARAQVENEATFTRKLSTDDGKLDFNAPAIMLKNRIRALTPHIGAYISHDKLKLKIGKIESTHEDCQKYNCGEIVEVGHNGLKIATARGALVIHELQRPGGKMLPVKDFINGFPLKCGDIFKSQPMQEMLFGKPYKYAAIAS